MSNRSRRTDVISALVAVAIATTVAQAGADPAPVDQLAADFGILQGQMDADIGIALSPVGSALPQVRFGTWDAGPAWSTMKVPVAMAALRAPGSAGVTPEMISAITQSDNAAAEAMWAGLGDPATAAAKVDAVLRDAGDDTLVQAERVRPEFSAFGQTTWSLINQSRFLAAAACDRRNAPVFEFMGRISPDQRWGVGGISGAQFKSGWGPAEDGAYLVRQMALIHTPGGTTAVAIAAEPASGSYDDGIANLSEVARWLTAHLAALPAGKCAGS